MNMQLSGPATKPAPASPPQKPASSGGLASMVTGWIGTLGTGIQVFNQQRLASENLRRARQGLDPLTYQDVPGLVPTVQVQGGVDSGTGNRLLLGAVAVAAALFLSGLLGKKKK